MSSLHYHEPTTSNQYESRRKLVANLLHTYELICTGASGQNFRGRGWPHRYNNNNNNNNNNTVVHLGDTKAVLCGTMPGR